MPISFALTSTVFKKNYFFKWKTFSEIFNFWNWYILSDTAEIWTVAGKASWDPANRRQKLGLVWKIERKLAKFLMTTFAYRSSSYLFYGSGHWQACTLGKYIITFGYCMWETKKSKQQKLTPSVKVAFYTKWRLKQRSGQHTLAHHIKYTKK